MNQDQELLASLTKNRHAKCKIHTNKQINKFIKSGVSVYTLKFLTGTVVSGLAGQIHMYFLLCT